METPNSNGGDLVFGGSGPEKVSKGVEYLEPTLEGIVEEVKGTKERAVFTNPRDEAIFDEIVNIFMNKYESHHVDFSIDNLKFCIDKLIMITPIKNDSGNLVICGEEIEPKQKEIIDSRLSASEIDIMGRDGAIGELPEIIKSDLFSFKSPYVEITSGCTNSCSFCAFSEKKGHIRSKLSFSSTSEIMRNFAQAGGVVYPYYGTDPFDAKWEADPEEISQRDMSDVYKIFAEYSKEDDSCLFVTTAVPLGEELNVLRYVISNIHYDTSEKTAIRFSDTGKNTERIEAIKGLLGQIDSSLEPTINSRKVLLNLTKDHESKRGPQLIKDGFLDKDDLYGPESNDGLVISPNGIDCVVMTGLCQTQPNGFIRFPAVEKQGDVTKVTFPIYYDKSRYYWYSPYPVEKIQYTIHRGNENSPTKEYVVYEDPLRALLHLQWTIYHALTRSWPVDIEKIQLSIQAVVDYEEEHPRDPFVKQILDWQLPTEGGKSLRDLLSYV